MESKKSKEAELDNVITRSGFVVMGLVMSVAITLVMMEYIKIVPPNDSLYAGLQELQEEEIMEQQFVEPNEPPPPPPAPQDEIEIVEDEAEVEETEVKLVDTEKDVIKIIEVVEEEEVVEVEEIYEVVEENPEFKGGMAELYAYLNKEIVYPPRAKENNIQGKVYVQFVVWKDGSIRDVKVLKGVHKSLDDEAVRVVKNMPNWNPGKQRGKSVSSRFTLPIKFKMS